jgi:hypothetical protein
MGEELRSILAGTAGLSVAAAIAAWLTFARGPIVVGSASQRKAVGAAVLALVCQAAHFAEELVNDFPQHFPMILGLAPWSRSFFVSFNMSWLVIWGLSCWGAAAGLRVALFPIWFLGIASLANGFAHPLLSVRVNGYFPGLLTSPLVGVTGMVLLRQMALATRSLPPGSAPPGEKPRLRPPSANEIIGRRG